MPIYKITAPDGTVYKVTGPEGSTEAQALEQVRASHQSGTAEVPKAMPTFRELLKREALGSLPVATARGVKDLIDTGAGYLSRLGGADEQARVRAADKAGRDEFDAATEGQVMPAIARLGGNLLGVVPATAALGGGVVAAGLPKLGQAIASSGMAAGPVAPGAAGWAASMGLRTAGGAIAGGLGAGMVNPDDAALGAGIGAVTPGLLKVAGWAGSKVYNAVKGGQPGAGKMLAEALGVTPTELQAMIRAAESAPDSIVDGSKLTFGQALQQQGAQQPSAQMLERIVSGGPGGDTLLKRYAEQGAARMEALQRNGAQTYQGAVKEEATRAGDRIGAVLRTQAADDADVTRQAWEKLYERGAKDGVKVRLPLDAMDKAMAPLGRGSVGVGKDARAVLKVAEDIGTLELPAAKAVNAGPAPISLAQAVRKAGGLSINSHDGFRGELASMRGDYKNLIRTNGGQSPGRMAMNMHEAGYLPDSDVNTLLNALRDDAYGGGAGSIYDDLGGRVRAGMDAAMGDAVPGAERVPVSVPFDEFQRLRRDSGGLGAKAAEDASRGAESKVLYDFETALNARMDDAAAGNLRADEFMPQGFREQYNAARGMTRADFDRYGQSNNIGAILRKPVGQDYKLTGDEIFNKLWHGGAGLAGDVSNLKQVLSGNNFDPSMDVLRRAIMTEAAGKTTASGNLGASLPKYVENRMPGLLEAMTPEQMKALSSVADDIRNAEAAAAVPGLRGSDTQAKISRALDAGLLDSPIAKALARITSFKGVVGGESLRAGAANAVIAHKGKTIAQLLADPKAAAAALKDAEFAAGLSAPRLRALAQVAARAAPVVAAD